MQYEGRMPDYLLACVGGGSNAIGLFHSFLTHTPADEVKNIKYCGIEAGGIAIEAGKHAARFAGGSVGVFQGCKSYLLQDEDGNVLGTHSVSAGLDYASVGPQHAYLFETGQVHYTYASDDEALNAFEVLSRKEGIIPALESAHALAYAFKLAKELSDKHVMIVNLSGRGDKDVQHVAKLKGIDLF
ncbi:tryptophan synthase beta subunit [Candidatus Magnetoovum chiemensis]|nr:tryptophan synthase beta subunit [Candidatus Magnetoovum chiemensis]